MVDKKNNQTIVNAFLIVLIILFIFLSIEIIPRIPSSISQVFMGRSFITFLLILLCSIFITRILKNDLAKLLFLLLLFSMPLAYMWNSGTTNQAIIGGLIPHRDSMYYYLNARSLNEGFKFSTALPGRPIYPAFLSLIFSLTGTSISISLLIQMIIIVISVFFFLKELKNNQFNYSIPLFLLGIFYFIRNYLYSFMTEDLGIAIALLCVVAILSGLRKESPFFLFIGFFFLSLSQNIRPNTLLVIPMVGLWYFIYIKNKKINFSVILALLVLLSGFIINSYFQSSFSSPGTQIFSSFAHGFYGQTKGGAGWTQIFKDFPGISDSTEIMTLAVKNILRNPIGIVLGILKSYRDFFLPSDIWAFVYITNPIRTIGNYLSWFLITAFSILGIYQIYHSRKSKFYSLFLFIFIGLFLSIPFAVPRDSGYMRTYATIHPFLLFFPLIGMENLVSRHISPKHPDSNFKGNGYSVSFLIFSILITSLLLVAVPINGHLGNHSYTKNEIVCSSTKKTVAFEITEGSYFMLMGNEKNCGLIPDLCIDQFLKNGMQKNHVLFDLTKSEIHPNDNYLFTLANDLITNDNLYVLIPLDKKNSDKNFSGLYYGCARIVNKDEFFYVLENFQQIISY